MQARWRRAVLGCEPNALRASSEAIRQRVGIMQGSRGARMSHTDNERGHRHFAAWAPVIVGVVLTILSIAVWRMEIAHKRALVRSHAEDICRQASRRLQVVIEGSLTTVTFLAGQWAGEGPTPDERDRFDALARSMVDQIPGVYAVRWVPAGGGEPWVVPKGVATTWPQFSQAEANLLGAALHSGVLQLSAPIQAEDKSIHVHVVLPIRERGPSRGTFVVEYDAARLIGSGFQQRIRSEFAFEVTDGGSLLYSFAPDGPPLTQPYRDLATLRSFQMRNRTWQFDMVPRESIGAQAGGAGSTAILLFGLLMSSGLAGMVHVLGRRLEQLRRARDRALVEIADRKRAEEALRVSEERYRSVFESATDGLLVLDEHDAILEGNPAACRMHGRQPGQLDGTPIRRLIAPESQRLYEAFKSHPDEAGVFRADAIHVRADGSRLDVEVRASNFHVGAVRRTLAILTDVTERNRALQRLGKLSRQALMAQEEERARVSRDLHDELGQLLTASRFELGWLQKHGRELSGEASGAVGRAVELVETAADELRRICKGLRPPLLDDLGLEPAAHLLAREFEDRTGLSLDFEVSLDDAPSPLSKEVSLCTYRIFQEALNNISRHSSAKSVDVTLAAQPNELLLSVYDDGQGFDISELAGARGCGIAGMRERASLVGGHVEIRSAPSQGTRVILRVPLEQDQREIAT